MQCDYSLSGMWDFQVQNRPTSGEGGARTNSMRGRENEELAEEEEEEERTEGEFLSHLNLVFSLPTC